MKKNKFEVKFTDVQKINPLFSKCKIYVMYIGDNRNMSSISKDAVMNALPTLYNCPIIGEYNETIEDFKGHGGKVEITSEGVQYIQTTKPYGLIPESSIFSWENVMESDGTMHEYLVIEGFLWTGRYPEAIRVVETTNNQSMEIENCLGEYRADGVFQIDSFIFSALCILGNDVEPCFQGAKVVGYSLDKDKFKLDFNQMVIELKESLKESGEKMENEIVKEIVTEEEVVVAEVFTEEEEEVVVVEEKFEENAEVEAVVVAEEVIVVADVIVTGVVVEETINKDAEFQILNDKVFELNSELVSLQTTYSALELESVDLREYKRLNELAKENSAKDLLIAEFSIGLTAEEMKPVVDNIEVFSLSEIKSKLNEIFTAKNLTSLKKKFTKDGVEEVIISDIVKKDVAKSRYAV